MKSVIEEVPTQQLYNFCHDFKTPLSTIMGMTTLTWNELGDREKVRDCLSRIETASSYLLSMVNDVLDYSQLVNGKMLIRHEAFTLQEVLLFINQLLSPHFQKKHQTFETKFTDISQEKLVGDFLRLNQILINILSNAIKYTAVGGKITLEFVQYPISKKSLIMCMKISDTGIGMSKDFMKTMFEPYSLAEDHQFSRESTGLGLYIVKNLIELMEGEIDVVSQPMQGTTVSIRIPFDIGEEQDNNSDEAGKKLLPNERLFTLKDFDFEGKNILIAEDNPDMLEITSTMLRPSGINIISARNGIQALDSFRNSYPGSIDMILMDIRMPIMNGFEATEAIRRANHPDSEKVVIVALSACSTVEEEQKAFNYGMNAYLNKPIDYFSLLNLMDYYIKNKESE